MEYQNSSLAIVSPKINISKDIDGSTINRNDFPDDFVFGTATSAYQVEGCATKDGRTPSIWDSFTMMTPAKIEGGSNGNVAADMYSKYKEDIIAMKNLGFDAYRFSISWNRILPGGHRDLGVNQEGIDYYNDLIDTIIANGMEPFVTVFHFDFPQVLQAEYGGFLSKKVVKDFVDYAEVCFWEFGDRVKYWILINEPWTYSVSGYVTGTFPPGQAEAPAQAFGNHLFLYRGSPGPAELIKSQTKGYTNFKPLGDPAKDVYIVGRNLLLAQAAAAQSYRTNFKERQKGKIGISLNCNWYQPYLDTTADIDASKRALDFMIGWFLEPLLTGKYPQTMIDNVQDNLAPFTDKESEMVKGSLDFLGINYYTGMYIKDDPDPTIEASYYKDMHAQVSLTDAQGKLIGPQAGSPWLHIVPWGLYRLLTYLKTTYKTKLPPIYITENGVDEKNNPDLTSLEGCVDPIRIKFHQDHLAYLKLAMDDPDDPVDVKGYFIWSYCDNFEWAAGYGVRFGIIYVDYRGYCKRYQKHSALWFSKFLLKKIEGSKKRRIEESLEEHGGAVKKLRATEE